MRRRRKKLATVYDRGRIYAALQQHSWFCIFVFIFVLMFGLLCYGKTDLDLGMMAFLVLSAGLLLGLSLAVTGLLGRLRPSFRRYSAPINLSLSMLIMLVLSGYFYERSTFPAQFERVKVYVVVAVPALHDYHSQYGRYPDSLSQLNLVLPIPAGLEYEHIVNSGRPAEASCELGTGNDVYSINFKDAFLLSDGKWFIDP